MKRNRSSSRRRQSGAIKESALTLRSSSQSNVDVESKPSAVIMKGNRRRSRGRQGGAVMKETTLTLRSSSQSSVDIESQPSAVIMKGNRRRSRGRQGGTVMKETTLTLRSSSQSSVDVESQSSALIKEGNRTRISGGRDDAVTTKGDPQKQITERYAAQKTRDSMPPKVRSRGNVPSGSTSHQSSQRRRHQ
ncbi:hypothetical protein KIN20_032652 [Parelaphostrongylus tenuis]|uniref:Uncharacterized protein n=1 Tax=Parelaphostrongylus tenuis TaxID=148309 RepID=A0AAD5WIM9_PARTN|nr:hypothetical protein KIN20_032652 [Parelaphostrongylus tenuis]